MLLVFLNTTMANAQNNTIINPRQHSMVVIAALTATGNLDSLKPELATALDAGMSINEIKEELAHLYAYCGFPRSLNAINTFRSVLEKRKADGIRDSTGRPIKLHTNNSDRYERGRRVLEQLTKTPQSKPAPGFGEFAPRIDAFLKEHLFADIFDSDVLTYQQRELVTITALAAMPGLEAQLNSHVGIGKNMGLTNRQLEQVAGLVERFVSRTQANTLRKVLGNPIVPVAEPGLMIRISEIEILPAQLKAYNAILTEEAAASVKKEPGVIAIFPMYQKENPAQIRIVEIYANKDAYQLHLKTSHFQHYKTTTLNMVKSLKLVDMESLDKETMLEIFRKFR